MISTKERENMAKGNVDKHVEFAKNILNSVVSLVNKTLTRITDAIGKADLSDNTKKRIISAIILVPFAIYAICFSEGLFFFLAIIITILMTSEWMELIKKADDQKKWRLIGLAYIAIPMYCVLRLRMQDSNILLWMFAVIWATDIFAFFAGKTFGGPKLAPMISPNKTWTGLLGGIFASMIIGFLSSFMFNGGVLFFVFFSAILALVAQGGDLLESKFKRIFGVKDSGDIIPGHGGILDRLDGLMLAAPFLLFLVTAFYEKF